MQKKTCNKMNTRRPCAVTTQLLLQAIHLQSFPFHDKINCLNWLKFEHFLKSSGSEFHSTGAAYLKEFLPNLLVRTDGICKILESRKLYTLPLFCRRFVKTGGAKPFKILNVSIAMVLIPLICKVESFVVIQGRRRRYGRSGRGQTTFLAKNCFGRTTISAEYDFFIFAWSFFSAELLNFLKR